MAQAVSGGGILWTATCTGNSEIVRLLLERRADVDATGMLDVTPLLSTCLLGYTEIAGLLLDHGADPNGRDWQAGITPLMAATYYGHTDTVRLLLDRGAKVDAAAPDEKTQLEQAKELLKNADRISKQHAGNDGEPGGGDAGHAKWEAMITEVVNGLAKAIAGPEGKAPTGAHATALWMAAAGGRVEIVRMLLAAGASVDGYDKSDDVTPLWVAAWKGHVDIVKLLVDNGANVNATDSIDGLTPLEIAKQKGHDEIVSILEEHIAINIE